MNFETAKRIKLRPNISFSGRLDFEMWPFVSFYIYWYSICKTKTEKKLKSLAWKYRIGSLAHHCGSRGRRRFQQTHQAIGCIKNYWSVSRIKSSYNCKWNKLGTQHYKILLFLLYMRKRQGVLKLFNALVNWQNTHNWLLFWVKKTYVFPVRFL